MTSDFISIKIYCDNIILSISHYVVLLINLVFLSRYLRENKIDKLKINYKYVFIKYLNENDMLISVFNKFRKGPIINYNF